MNQRRVFGRRTRAVLSAIKAGVLKSAGQRPVTARLAIGFLAMLGTWFVAVGIVDDLTENINALLVQLGVLR